MKHLRLLVSGLAVLILVLILEGCAKPPDTEKQAAKAAMDVAVSAGGDKYAVTDMEAAKKIWDTAEFQMKDKKYKEAKQSYIDAKAAFEKAAGAVESGKKAIEEMASTPVQEHYPTLTGTVVGIQGGLRKWLDVKRNKDEVIVNFRIGRKTVYIPHRYPYIGEKVKVEYLTDRGVNVAYTVTMLGQSKKNSK